MTTSASLTLERYRPRFLTEWSDDVGSMSGLSQDLHCMDAEDYIADESIDFSDTSGGKRKIGF